MADNNHLSQPANEEYPPFVALVVNVLQEIGAVFTLDGMPIVPEPQKVQEDE